MRVALGSLLKPAGFRLSFLGGPGAGPFACPDEEDHPERLAEDWTLQQLLPAEKVRSSLGKRGRMGLGFPSCLTREVANDAIQLSAVSDLAQGGWG